MAVSASVPVLPVMAPSCTNQSLGLPSQPFRTLPLKSGLKSSSGSAASSRVAEHPPAARLRANRNGWSFFIKEIRYCYRRSIGVCYSAVEARDVSTREVLVGFGAPHLGMAPNTAE